MMCSLWVHFLEEAVDSEVRNRSWSDHCLKTEFLRESALLLDTVITAFVHSYDSIPVERGDCYKRLAGKA